MSTIPFNVTAAGVVVANGASVVVTLSAPGRASISKLIVTQTAGTQVAFTAIVLETLLAAQGTNQLDSAGATIPPDNFEATKTFASSSGKIKYFADDSTGGKGYTFVNRTVSPVGAELGVKREIYLRLTNGGANPATFCISMAGEGLS